MYGGVILRAIFSFQDIPKILNNDIYAKIWVIQDYQNMETI
jgi:hypothetical protein